MTGRKTPLTILCIACTFKGTTFMRACKELGARVLLLTSRKLEHEAWPYDCIDGHYYMEDNNDFWDNGRMLRGVSFMARHETIDRIVPLDDFDLEKAAALREHLRVNGMGDTRTRFFRDKLSMRMKAMETGIPVPEYVHTLNHAAINTFMDTVPAPWVLKPRMQASAAGIQKLHNAMDAWNVLNALDAEQSFYLLERFVPGDIYHVDSIIDHSEIVFSRVSRYLAPPMEVVQGGGIFRTHTIVYDTPEDHLLRDLNQRVLQSFGLRRGVSHTEFIRAYEDGRLYFLETSARVGGAHIAEMVEASAGFNFWREWAQLENLDPNDSYRLPEIKKEYAGIISTLARQEKPDMSAYNDPEIVWHLDKRYHAGLIVRSASYERVCELLDSYLTRFRNDFVSS